MLSVSLLVLSERELTSNRAGMKKKVRKINVLRRLWSLRSNNKNVPFRMNV